MRGFFVLTIYGYVILSFKTNPMLIDNSALRRKNLAVLIIDMQPKFQTSGMHDIIPAQIAVIRFCAKNSIPLFVVTYDGYGKIIPVLDKEIKAVKHVVFIEKAYDNAFDDTHLYRHLKKFRSKNLFLMGINTGACVLATALGAQKHKYRVITGPQVTADNRYIPCTLEESWRNSAMRNVTIINDIEFATQIPIPHEKEIIYSWSYRIEKTIDTMIEAIFCRLRPFFNL